MINRPNPANPPADDQRSVGGGHRPPQRPHAHGGRRGVEVAKRLAHSLLDTDDGWELAWATVVSAQAGPPHSLTVKIGGSSTSVAGVRYADSITSPVANDQVLLVVHRKVPFAICRVAS